MDLITKIKQKMASFSKGQRAIARYIVANYDKASYMSAKELANNVGVSESTVIRFAEKMGYEGYGFLQRKLAEVVQNRINENRKLDFRTDDMDLNEIADYIAAKDMENIKNSRKQLDLAAIEQGTSLICEAEFVYIIGFKNCSFLTKLLEYNLNYFSKKIIVIDNLDIEAMYLKLMDLSEKDVVIGISFPRYSIQTINALEFANMRKSHIIALTDQKYSPLCMYSSCNLYANCGMSSIVDSFTAAVNIINILTVSVYMRKRANILTHFDQYERIIQSYTREDSDEIDWINSDYFKTFQ